VRDRTPGFTGISDLGGPTANMYRWPAKIARSRRPAASHRACSPASARTWGPITARSSQLYRKARALPGVKKVLIASGLRYDLAVRSPAYVKELAQHHTGGYLKIAPEHTEGRSPRAHDEAGHRHLRPVQGAVRSRQRRRPARSST
jgi:radical SAM superfamily enzyme YgiQ (UPF0313 family)